MAIRRWLILLLFVSATSLLPISARIFAADEPDLAATAASLLATMRANHFHPAELETEAYKKIEDSVRNLGSTAASPEEFLNGFNTLWRGGPFSHVRLYYRPPTVGSTPPDDPARPGNGIVSLAWQNKVAILTVNSMSNSSELIEAAYHEIVGQGAATLIIDLRRNGGGAFGVMPLIGHLIDEARDIGVFVTNRWYEDHQTPPSAEALKTATPCTCTDAAFATDMETRALTSYRIEPLLPRFSGPVYVLTSRVSISAAEIAAEALQASGRATIVGEKTPGVLLQPKLFTVGNGFSLMWPIGDYRTVTNGRIEGVGVTPDITASADTALEVALSR